MSAPGGAGPAPRPPSLLWPLPLSSARAPQPTPQPLQEGPGAVSCWTPSGAAAPSSCPARPTPTWGKIRGNFLPHCQPNPCAETHETLLAAVGPGTDRHSHCPCCHQGALTSWSLSFSSVKQDWSYPSAQSSAGCRRPAAGPANVSREGPCGDRGLWPCYDSGQGQQCQDAALTLGSGGLSSSAGSALTGCETFIRFLGPHFSHLRNGMTPREENHEPGPCACSV